MSNLLIYIYITVMDENFLIRSGFRICDSRFVDRDADYITFATMEKKEKI